MKENKVTKRAIFASLLSVAVCTSMLIGTSYAWFTDSVTSSGNIIKSGTLDIELQYADEADPDQANWKDASTGAIFDYDLWEPGYVSVKQVKLANVGSLALKYQFNIIPNGTLAQTEDGHTLADVIDVYYYDPATEIEDRADLGPADDTNPNYLGTLSQALAGVADTAEGKLYPAGNAEGKDSEVKVTLALKMKEEAGNEYQDMSVGNSFAVQVIATQWTYEEDTFNDQYDALADTTPDITMTDATGFAAALGAAQDGDVINANGENLGALLNTTVDAEVTIENAVFDAGTDDYAMITTTFNKPVTFKNCTFKANKGIYGNKFNEGAVFEDCTVEGSQWSFYNNAAKGDVTFKNCRLTSDYMTMNFQGGSGQNTITIDGCTISAWASFSAADFGQVIIKNTHFVNAPNGVSCVRLYQNATITDCVFDDDYYWNIDEATRGIRRAIDACAANITITINNTTINPEYLAIDTAPRAGVHFIVDGTEVTPKAGS